MAKWRLATATLRSYLQTPSPTIYPFRRYSTSLVPRGKWLTLPPFSHSIDGSALGKELFSDKDSIKGSSTTALKWILRCRPDLPRNLLLKLFRLRQVRREMSVSCDGDELERSQLKRVGVKESLNVGDRIYLPLSVDNDSPPPVKKESFSCSEEELNFICSLVLYKVHRTEQSCDQIYDSIATKKISDQTCVTPEISRKLFTNEPFVTNL